MAEKSTTNNFTDDERAAMKERAKEVRSSRGKSAADNEADVLEKIAEMAPEDRVIAERIHALGAEHAPQLAPKTWYGFPAYAKGGKTVLFFQAKAKFTSRYSTLGFNDDAALDDGAMWPTAYAIVELTDAVEERIAALIVKAAG